MAWCKQQHAIDWANVDRNLTSHKNTLIINRIYQNNKKTWQFWQLKFPARRSREQVCVGVKVRL